MATAATKEAYGEKVATEELVAMKMATVERSKIGCLQKTRYDDRAMFCACHPSNLLFFAFSICRR